MTSPTSLHVQAHGDPGAQTTLVLLHGLTDSAGCWPDAVDRWLAAGHRVVTVDARGHGRSPRWTVAELDPAATAPGDRMAQDVVRLLPGLAAASVVLVGHSMGAGVAVAAAARVVDPARNEAGRDGAMPPVAGVVAEDPVWPLPPRTGPDAEAARRYLTGWEADAARSLTQRAAALRAEHPGWARSEVERCAEAREDCQRELLATGDIVPRTPWPDLVSAVTGGGVRVLLVTGEVDVRVDGRSAALAAERGADVVRVAGAGHCVRRDDPDAYHRAVEAFLAGLARGRR